MENSSADAAKMGASATSAQRETHRETASDPDRISGTIEEEREQALPPEKIQRTLEIMVGLWPLRYATDWQNALHLLKYLRSCHRAVLSSPGIESALRHNADFGVHMDPAFRLIDGVLYELECGLQV